MVKVLSRTHTHARCVTSFRETASRCDNIKLDMFYRPKRSGWTCIKWWNQISHACCAVFESRTVSTPTRPPNDMPGCYMWFVTKKATQAQHVCNLVQETKPYESSGVAGKSRWKSGSWTKIGQQSTWTKFKYFKWLIVAFITWNSNLVPLLKGLWSSNSCRFDFSVFGFFAGIEPTTSGLTVPRSDQLS